MEEHAQKTSPACSSPERRGEPGRLEQVGHVQALFAGHGVCVFVRGLEDLSRIVELHSGVSRSTTSVCVKYVVSCRRGRVAGAVLCAGRETAAIRRIGHVLFVRSFVRWLVRSRGYTLVSKIDA